VVPATAATLGGVIIGDNINVDPSGKISLPPLDYLPLGGGTLTGQPYYQNAQTPLWHGGNLRVESGTWTTTLAGATTAGSHTYGTRTGQYLRIGPLVLVSYQITLTAKDGAMAGGLRITGLPFSCNMHRCIQAACQSAGTSGLEGAVISRMDTGTSYIQLHKKAWSNTAASSGLSGLQPGDVGANFNIMGSLAYRTAQ